jgi:putative endonuclease
MSGESRAARGRTGEAAGAAWLAGQGWTIVERNFRARIGEIDIIAERGDTLAFCEVKSWATLPASELEYAIDAHKQMRIAHAARLFLARHPSLRARRPRFDVLFIRPNGGPVRYIENAFQGGID